MLRLFQDSFIFGKATPSHLFRITSSTQQLLFGTATFWADKLFRIKDSFIFGEATFSHLFRVTSLTQQLLFGTATFLAEKLFRIQISAAKLLFRSRYFRTASTFSEQLHFRMKLIFQKNKIPYYLLFLEGYLFRTATFQNTLPCIAATLSEELLFHNILFQRSYYLTATLPFHRYTSYLSVSN